MENKLHILISNIERDSEAIIQLVQMFEPLLKKYSFQLKYEDAYSDLQLFLIELVKKLNKNALSNTEDKYYLSYIKKSIRNKYIDLSKKQKKICDLTIEFCSLDDEYEDVNFSNLKSNEYFDFRDLQTILTLSEYEILYMIFCENRSISEIAYKRGTSRQYINQSKLNAIKKVKEHYFK